ncbi:DNA polymerase delta subunit 4 isoform X3 [Nerophis lumbriciformis]|uniref:DNA polymerase delta subunit 4 isoform X3 n=1 Tax=Nerophis lumbriciformis TaxID=546530 RepID=UPI002AE08D55|nr:DNA polymerase delta subunit 4-like isoform X3 [Nerophis lumbriciformis]
MMASSAWRSLAYVRVLILRRRYTVTETCQHEEQQKLQQFDLDWRFGPSTGISRLQRWERAKLHGLDPPEEIRDLLLQNQTDPEYNLSLWREYPL